MSASVRVTDRPLVTFSPHGTKCSFCGKEKSNTVKLIATKDGKTAICFDCVKEGTELARAA